MNNITISRLTEVILEAEGAELASVDCAAVPSPSFSRRIERIAGHPEKYANGRRVKKRIIFLIAAALILTGCTAIKPIRTTIANFIVTIYEKYMSIEQNRSEISKSTIEAVYSPEYIPDNYVIVKESDETADHFIIAHIIEYKNNEKTLRFSQHPANASMSLDTESAETKTLKADNFDIMCIYKNGILTVVWEYDGYRFRMVTQDDFSEETIMKITKSVKIHEFTNY